MFTDEQNREYFFNITFTADNSLFTCYNFLADHHSDYHIVLEQVIKKNYFYQKD